MFSFLNATMGLKSWKQSKHLRVGNKPNDFIEEFIHKRKLDAMRIQV